MTGEPCPYCENGIVEGETVVQLTTYDFHPLHVDEFEEVTYHSRCFMEMFNAMGAVSRASIVEGRVEKKRSGVRSVVRISDPTDTEKKISEGINELGNEYVQIPVEIKDWPPAAKLVYRVVGDKKEVKKREVIESTGLSLKTVDKHLNGLVDEGLVRVNSYEDGQTYQIEGR